MKPYYHHKNTAMFITHHNMKLLDFCYSYVALSPFGFDLRMALEDRLQNHQIQEGSSILV